jgi:hypothetical protein
MTTREAVKHIAGKRLAACQNPVLRGPVQKAWALV